MRVPLEWLRSLVSFPDSAQSLSDRLTVAGIEVTALEVMPDGEEVLDLEILPNMARCLSIAGVAREVAALTGYDARLEFPLAPLPPEDRSIAPVIEGSDVCGRFMVAIIENLEGDSQTATPEWIRRRLDAAGIPPVSGLVDLANYVMVELGQPLHLYDLARLGSARLSVRISRPGESLHLLSQPADSAPTPLPPGIPVIVDAGDHPVTVAGIVGGRPSAVASDTTEVLVEVANFDFIAIRRAQAALGIRTEASARFSRGVDPSLVETALRRFLALLPEVAPNASVRASGESGLWTPRRDFIALDTAELNRKLGTSYSVEDLVAVFDRLNLPFERRHDVLTVEVDEGRPDLTIPEDLMEEVIRIIGFDTLPATMPEEDVSVPRWDLGAEGREALREAMTRAGLTEVITYTLTSRDAVELGSPSDTQPVVSLLNPLSQEHSVVRRSLLPGLLDALSSNARFTDSAGIFELGVVVLPERPGIDSCLPSEPLRLAFAMTGEAEPDPLWSDSTRRVDFYDAAAVVLDVVRHLHLGPVRFRVARSPIFAPEACAAVIEGETVFGHVGLVDDSVAKHFGLEGRPILACELDADALVARRRIDFRVEEPGRFPSVYLDLSVAVPVSVPFGALIDEAVASSDDLLQDVSVFDVYSGDGIPRSHCAIGLRLTIGAPDRTLTTAEAEAVRERMVARLHDKFGAIRR